MSCKIPPEVQGWIDIVENNIYPCCEEQKLLVKYVRKCFETEDIYVDEKRLEKYMHLADEYATFDLFEWQKFVIALHDCTFWNGTGMPRWPDLFCMIGRGAGKDGMIAVESMCLSSPYNEIREYDVDICGNNEEQAVRPVADLTGFFERPEVMRKIKHFYSWTLEKVICTKTKSVIKGRTNNPKGKDGLRSGIVVFNEIHQYQNYANIDVFTTGLGKKKHPRRSYYTTNGDIREGPLDDLLNKAKEILYEQTEDFGMLPFICKLDKRKEVHKEEMWTKANPSLPYMPNLMTEIRKEYRDWREHPEQLPAFMSKRMNLPDGVKESGVTDWEYIEATKKELPDLDGWSCVAGIDYAKISDFASVNLHFKKGDMRFDISHSWLCLQSKDLSRLKVPWKEWAAKGYITLVDDVEIHPSLLTSYIYEMGRKYNISMLALDNFRYALLKTYLDEIGFSKEQNNLKLVSQIDIMKIAPVIDHCFVAGLYTWGEAPVLRWATNNTKLIPYGRQQGTDKGSFVYGKIEAKSRKTDPFMALVACMVVEGELERAVKAEMHDIPVLVF